MNRCSRETGTLHMSGKASALDLEKEPQTKESVQRSAEGQKAHSDPPRWGGRGRGWLGAHPGSSFPNQRL